MRAATIITFMLAALLVAGCGGDDETTQEGAGLRVPWVDPDGEPPWIGAVAVNPSDGSVFIASNTGLFHVPPQGGRPAKVVGQLRTPDGAGPISEALVVRFTGPDQLIGSGHPASGSSLPPVLGLIRSDDAGRTWRPVSELGSSDFHAFARSKGLLAAPIYGQAQILVSRDDGKTFEARVAPMALVDLAIDPGDPSRWVATSDQGIYTSGDEGRTWRQRDPTPNVRLTWFEPDLLYRVDPGGPIKVSADGGETWEDRGSTGGEPQAMTADEQGRLYVATLDGTVQRSDDGGRAWRKLVTPPR